MPTNRRAQPRSSIFKEERDCGVHEEGRRTRLMGETRRRHWDHLLTARDNFACERTIVNSDMLNLGPHPNLNCQQLTAKQSISMQVSSAVCHRSSAVGWWFGEGGLEFVRVSPFLSCSSQRAGAHDSLFPFREGSERAERRHAKQRGEEGRKGGREGGREERQNRHWRRYQ